MAHNLRFHSAESVEESGSYGVPVKFTGGWALAGEKLSELL